MIQKIGIRCRPFFCSETLSVDFWFGVTALHHIRAHIQYFIQIYTYQSVGCSRQEQKAWISILWKRRERLHEKEKKTLVFFGFLCPARSRKIERSTSLLHNSVLCIHLCYRLKVCGVILSAAVELLPPQLPSSLHAIGGTRFASMSACRRLSVQHFRWTKKQMKRIFCCAHRRTNKSGTANMGPFIIQSYTDHANAWECEREGEQRKIFD